MGKMRAKSKVKACDPYCSDIVRVAAWRAKAKPPKGNQKPKFKLDEEKETGVGKKLQKLFAMADSMKKGGGKKEKNKFKRAAQEAQKVEQPSAETADASDNEQSESQAQKLSVVSDDAKKTSLLSERKKIFYQKKKLKKLEKRVNVAESAESGKPYKAPVKFGEVVDAPPTLTVFPKQNKTKSAK